MIEQLKLPVVFLGVALLAGCGGSGSGSKAVTDMDDMEEEMLVRETPFNTLGTSADRAAAELGFLTETEADDLAPARPGDLLVAGSATYEGQVAVLIGEAINDESRDTLSDADILGEVSLDVDFTNGGGTLSGEMTNFIGNDGERYTGALDVAEAALTIEPEAVGVIADVTGTLRDSDRVATAVDAGLVGAFLEDDYFFGIVGGTLETDGVVEDALGVVIVQD